MAASQRSRREVGVIIRPPSPIVGLRRLFQPNTVPGLVSGDFGGGDGRDHAIAHPMIHHRRPQAFPYSFRRTVGRGDVVNGAGPRLLPEIQPRWPPIGGSFWGSYGGGDGQLRAVFFSASYSRRVVDFPDHFVEVLDGEQEERAQPEPPLMAHPDLLNIFPVAYDDDDDDDEEEVTEEKSKEEGSREEKSEEDDNEGVQEVSQEDHQVQISTGSI